MLSPTRYALRSTGLKTKAGVIRVETRVAIAVRFCAGASYLDLRDIHGVSRTACYACFHQVSDAIVKCRSQIGAMEFPRTLEELQKLAAEFQASTFIRTHRLLKNTSN